MKFVKWLSSLFKLDIEDQYIEDQYNAKLEEIELLDKEVSSLLKEIIETKFYHELEELFPSYNRKLKYKPHKSFISKKTMKFLNELNAKKRLHMEKINETARLKDELRSFKLDTIRQLGAALLEVEKTLPEYKVWKTYKYSPNGIERTFPSPEPGERILTLQEVDLNEATNEATIDIEERSHTLLERRRLNHYMNKFEITAYTEDAGWWRIEYES